MLAEKDVSIVLQIKSLSIIELLAEQNDGRCLKIT